MSNKLKLFVTTSIITTKDNDCMWITNVTVGTNTDEVLDKLEKLQRKMFGKSDYLIKNEILEVEPWLIKLIGD